MADPATTGQGRLAAVLARAHVDRHDRGHVLAAAVVLVVSLLVLPSVLSLYWVDSLIQVAVYSVVALGLGLLVGRVGMFSLGQVAILAIGSWTAARLDYATTLPFPVILLIAGVVAGIFGVLVGLPALRLSGLDLALITLMLAGAVTIVLQNTNFPNGGHGFTGYTASPLGNPPIRRPSIASTDPGYLRYAVIVALLMFLLVIWHLRSKPGRAWATIRQSEAAAMASGVNITLYKIWAFALASFITGVIGAVLASSATQLYITPFQTQNSIELMAVVLMGGVFTVWGALIAALLLELLPSIFDIWNLSPFLLIILFGVGVIQVLATAPTGIAGQLPKDLARLGRAIASLASRAGGGRNAAGPTTAGGPGPAIGVPEQDPVGTAP
ncbi:MAG TPA: branched-chain amino acid ABC transporter permease [Acidimicrobiales bacterium]|nr:branched-chain amino acid ABC transporter permease [Acidimicrobiales bacterium]